MPVSLPIFASDQHWASLMPPVLASLMVGAAVFVTLMTVFNALHSDDLESEIWRYDINRINELRRVDPLFRLFQPVIQLFARFNRGFFRESLPEISREIQAAGLPRFWSPSEYLGRLELLAVLMSPIYVYFALEFMGTPGIIFATVMTALTAYFFRLRLAARAKYRLMQIKRRMPFLLDLLTLLMEAGATFLNALKEGVDQFGAHAVGQEFGRVLGEISMGKGRTGALESMRDRLSDDEITSIIGSIIQGEQLGTPLARLFRTQADVLRIKRTQRAETIAGEAGAKMLLPAVLVMASTVLIILGPFILGFLYSGFM